ncbi:MAG: sugar phosphate nucleotidyltransferase [Mucinivorans sp.]
MINIDQYALSLSSTILDALYKLEELSHHHIMVLFALGQDQKIKGTVTVGDVRRGLIGGLSLSSTVEEVMNANFTYLTAGDFDTEKLKFIKRAQLSIVPLLDKDGFLVKILNFQTQKSFLPIDAVLMAGGRGERLRPMTLTTPKPLLEVAGKPIIDYNIDNILDHGIEHINVTTNYLAEQFDAHFAKPCRSIQVRCVREAEFLGTMGSVKFIPSWHNDTILVMNSDLFTNVDLEDFFLHFKEHDADMSVAAVPYSVSIPYGIFEIEGARNIKGIREKPSFHYYANAGIYLIKRQVLDLVPDGEPFNATDLIDLLIARGRSVIRFPLSGYWVDIGKPEDFKKVQELAKHTGK